MSNFKHHPTLSDLLPSKCPSRACLPGVLAETNTVMPAKELVIPLVDAVEFAFLASSDLEPRTLMEALKQLDADKWVAAVLAEIKAHTQNGTWVLAQLPPGRRAISSWWVFKVKCLPDSLINKYKGRIVAQGFSQVWGIHYNEVFTPTAHLVAM